MKHRKPAPTWHRLGLKISKKVVVGITAAATAFGGLAIASTAAQASTDRDSYADTVENTTFEQARKHYGLAQQMSEGATLHAWEWSFKTIEENIPAIAEAGYTSVQTEPISAIHNGGKGMIFTENWYYVYQPTDTTIGNWVMGTEDLSEEPVQHGSQVRRAYHRRCGSQPYDRDLGRHRRSLEEVRVLPPRLQ